VWVVGDALHVCVGEINYYCAVFGLSLRSYNKVIQITVISIFSLSAARIY